MNGALAKHATTPPVASKQAPPVAGPRIAVLARYKHRAKTLAPASTRLLVVRSAGAGQQLWDEPASGTGGRYLIEPALHAMPPAERDALASEYVRHALQLGHPPLQPNR